jgi:NAD-dependent dihydropyrimidine dehydrogenase PreA subunit
MANNSNAHTPHQALANRVNPCMPGTPATQEQILAMFELLLSGSEARIAAALPEGWASLEDISSAVESGPSNLKENLDKMCAKGLVVDQHTPGSTLYRLQTNLFNFLKFSLTNDRGGTDKKASLNVFEEYLLKGSLARELFITSTPIFRIIPKEKAIGSDTGEGNLDEIATNIVESANTWAIEACQCTQIANAQEKPCRHSDHTLCIHFDELAQYRVRWGQAQMVTQAEALEKLIEAQKNDFVHLVDNYDDKVGTIHSCHPCHCLYLKGLKRSGVDIATIASSYQVRVDGERCSGCSECESACPMFAITMENNEYWELKPNVRQNECIGCGICVTGCPAEALKLIRRKN